MGDPPHPRQPFGGQDTALRSFDLVVGADGVRSAVRDDLAEVDLAYGRLSGTGPPHKGNNMQ